MANEKIKEARKEPEPLSIEDMEFYIVLGRKKNGEDVYLQSPNTTFSRLGIMVGALASNMVYQGAALGTREALTHEKGNRDHEKG